MSFRIIVVENVRKILHDKIRYLGQLRDEYKKGVKKASEEFARFVRLNYASGNLIQVRTGKLRSSIHPQVIEKGRSILGGISIGSSKAPYALIHIGDRNTWIYPKNVKHLTIPFGTNYYTRQYNKSPYQLGESSVLVYPFAGLRDSLGKFTPYFIYRETPVVLRPKVTPQELVDSFMPTFVEIVLSTVKELRVKRKEVKR